MQKNTLSNTSFWIFFVLSFVFFGGIFGVLTADFFVSQKITNVGNTIKIDDKTYVQVSELNEDFRVKLNKSSDFVVQKDRTWVPVEGNPVEFIVISDSTCGAACDPSKGISAFRSQMTPALVIRNLDIADDEAQKLIKKFDIQTIPAYILGEGAVDLEINGLSFVQENHGILTKKGGQFWVNNQKTRLPIGKFIHTPKFDKKEPKLGNGPVQVVEFTDFECPYCQRFDSQNRETLEKLAKKGEITYIVKDFPLGFHPTGKLAHIAANCVLNEGGNDKYFAFKDAVFDQRSDWAGKNESAKPIFEAMAGEIGVNIDGCWDDKDILAEMDADQTEGSKYGVSGTPSLFIGRQIMPGAIGTQALIQAINAEK